MNAGKTHEYTPKDAGIPNIKQKVTPLLKASKLTNTEEKKIFTNYEAYRLDNYGSPFM